ncbi:DUF2270 domain-containing protein [Haloferax namakaokahaiae]|uniref:DUF2270 domain-containing protein n=1 Tax=Haloferax namakaokahaiae TaxID=1748331 RepID=A0ABD5ZBQ1_9EURY
MADQNSDEFDATTTEARAVAAQAGAERDEFLSLIPHYYRGEVSQSGNLLTRLDLTTDWAIVLVTVVLALAFQGPDSSAYLLLIGLLGVVLFLLFDVRRYRTFDASRARIRLLEENVFANAFDPSDAPLEAWRVELAADLRTPTLKVSFREAVGRRLRRVYYAIFVLLGLAWVFRITLYAPSEPWTVTASVPGISGVFIAGLVALFFVAITALTFWPYEREARGEFHGEEPGRWRRER